MIMIAPIEVLDTGVKIGLGAIISAVGGYLIARLTLAKERSARRREILEMVAEQVEKIMEDDLSALQLGGVPKLEQHEAKFPSIESKLLLLGEKRSLKVLRDYRKTAGQGWWAVTSEGDNPEARMRLRKELPVKRELFFDSLSDAYRRF